MVDTTRVAVMVVHKLQVAEVVVDKLQVAEVVADKHHVAVEDKPRVVVVVGRLQVLDKLLVVAELVDLPQVLDKLLVVAELVDIGQHRTVVRDKTCFDHHLK